MKLLAPPITPPERVEEELRVSGHAVLDAAGLASLADTTVAELERLRPSWDDLPADVYLRDGGHYRRRRHGSFVVEGTRVTQVPHRAHWQPLEYNALHGGIERWFEPIDSTMTARPVWNRLLVSLARVFSKQRPASKWYVEAHPFRIDTTDGIGRPTPEGAHRDGVDFVAVILVARTGIKGGETRVFESDGPHGLRFTLIEPWSALLLDDERVVHESTPIQPLQAAAASGAQPVSAHRDTLVLTYRRAGFQDARAPDTLPR